MATSTWLRRLRGAVGNALVWGAGFFGAGLTMATTARLTGLLDLSWSNVIFTATQFGVVGGVAGGAFFSAVGLLYRGRRLSEINWVRFGLGGGLLVGVFVPLFLQAMNVISGDGLVPWELVLGDGLMMGVLGGAAAGVSLKLAQGADKALSDGSAAALDRSGEPTHLVPAGDSDD